MTEPNEPELPDLLREAGLSDSAELRDALTQLGPSAQAPPQRLRERLLANVARPQLRFAPLFGALAELFDLNDTDLTAIFERAAAPGEWVASQVPGTRLMHLEGGPRVTAADNGLVRLPAAARFPMHRHLGLERVLVLEGGYRDELSGRVYLPGDRQEMASGSSHALVALSDRELLFAVSVVAGVAVEGFGTLSLSAG